MNTMPQYLLFIQALLAYLDRLQALLGPAWPGFREQLLAALEHLDQARDHEQASRAIEQLIELGLESPAAELIRSLRDQAITQAGNLERTTAAVPMFDPTSAQTRLVEVGLAGRPVSKGVVVDKSEVVGAGQELAQALQSDRLSSFELEMTPPLPLPPPSHPPGSEPSPPPAPSPPKVKTYANLQGDDYAYLNQPYQLTVKLSDQPQQTPGDHMAVPALEVPVEPGEVIKKIQIRLYAPDFDLVPAEQALGWLRELTFYTEAGASNAVTFNLLPQDRLEPRYFAALKVQYLVQGEVIGEAARRVEVLQNETVARTPLNAFPKAPGYPLDEQGKVRLKPASDSRHTPLIYREREDHERIHLTVTIAEREDHPGQLHWQFASAYLSQTELPAGFSPNLGAQEFVKTYLAPFGMPGHWSNPHMDDQGQLKPSSIPTLLGNLLRLRDQAPPEFWEAYQKTMQIHLDRDCLSEEFTLLFRTGDTHIPWELMPVFETVQAGKMPPLLGNAHQVGRWLLGVDPPAPKLELNLSGFALAAPTYMQRPLPEAQAEAQFIQQHYRPYPLIESSEGFRTFMLDGRPTGGTGILHFAGHGDCCTDEIRGNWLVLSDEGDGDWYDIHAASNDLGNRLGKLGRDVLAFFNACNVGRAAPGPLGSNGGWGRALLHQQYQGYIGPLWSVYDKHARDVAETFYSLALDHHLPLGEVMRLIRAKFAEDNRLFTYLAYLYLGHPLARINYIN